MIKFIDTHAHLNDEKFTGSVTDAVDAAKRAGIVRIINMGDSVAASETVCRLTVEHEACFAAVGVHPEECRELNGAELDRLAELAADDKTVGIGEIGLDYYWEKDGERREAQKRLFRQQLDLARQLNLPVCIHDREAHEDTLKILREDGKGLQGVLHCFSGSYETAQTAFRLGFMIGVDGPVTFKNAAKLPETVQKSPRDMVLIETDSPYLAPEPLRGKRNEPALLIHIAAKVSELWGVTMEETARITWDNAHNLYGKISIYDEKIRQGNAKLRLSIKH